MGPYLDDKGPLEGGLNLFFGDSRQRLADYPYNVPSWQFGELVLFEHVAPAAIQDEF